MADDAPLTGTSRAKELIWLCLLALLWGGSYPLIKIAVATIPPITLIAMRVGVSGAFLLAVLWWTGQYLPRDARSWGLLLIQAFLNSIGAWTVLAWGQQYVDSGLASVLNSTSPIFVFFATLLITRHEATGSLRLIGAMLGVSGVVLIVGTDAIQGLGRQVAAQLAVLSGAVLYAGAAIHGHRLKHLSSSVTAAGTMIWASICLVPLSLAADRPWELAPSTESILAALVLSVLCTGMALLIYFRLIRTLGSLGVASQAYLRAGLGVVLGVVFLGETVTLTVGFGLALAMGGVIAINGPIRSRTIPRTAD